MCRNLLYLHHNCISKGVLYLNHKISAVNHPPSFSLLGNSRVLLGFC